MLESLRGIQNSPLGKLAIAAVMGLIMVSFVIWGIGPVFTGFNANQIASVGGASVTVPQFRQAYDNELQQLQQRAKRQITSAEAHQYGIDTQVLSRLVSNAVLDNQARALGLSISDEQIARTIRQDPSFKGTSGQFDYATFNNLLRDNNMTEQMFMREQRDVYLRQELVQGLVGNVAAPQAALDALQRFQNETRSLDYVVLPASAAGTLPQPDEAALKKFFADRATAFQAPEYRKLVILPILPATVAKPDQVSEADVQKLYDQVKDARYATPEYRTLQQIVFPNEQDATAAAQRLTAGTSFADIAAERKLSDKDIDLGRVTKASIFEKPVADAAFALPDNGVSAPIANAFGATLVHVIKIEPATVRPLVEVAPALRDEIARSRTGEAIKTIRNAVDDARASGKSLTEAGKAAGIETRTIDAVNASDLDKAGKPVEIPDAPAVLKAAFASDVGVDNDSVATPDGGQVFFEIAGIEPARPQTYDEVKPRVEAAWRQDETAKQLAAKADDLVKSIDAGQTMEQVASSLGLPLQHTGDVRRAGGTGVGPAVVAAAFNAPVGRAGSASGEGDTRVVFKILGSVVPTVDPESPQEKQLSDQYQSWLAEDMLGSTLTAMEGKLGVRINPEAFKNATGS